MYRLAGKRYYEGISNGPDCGWDEIWLKSLEGVELTNVLAHQGIVHSSKPFTTMHRFRTGSVSIDVGRLCEAFTNVNHYCMRYPLLSVRKACCSARSRTGLTRKSVVNDSKMMISSTKEICLQVSLVNAVACTVDDGYASLLMSGGKFPNMVSFNSAMCMGD